MTGFAEHRGQGGNRWRGLIWGMGAAALATPAIAMQFTSEVAWGPEDFAVFGVMLLAACGIYELAARASGSTAYRAGIGIAVAASFLLVWVNLAVGIVGSEDNPANLMFFGVLAVPVLGAIVSRARAPGMAAALAVTAAVQLLVGAIFFFSGMGSVPVFTLIYVALWLASGWLFRKAAME